MPEGSFPPVAELLPHRRRALLIDRVLSHDARETVCAVDPSASTLYRDRDGSVPAYVGLEYMAQTIAAHGGLLALSENGARPGLLLGSRRLVFSTGCFEAGRLLEVRATHLRGGTGLIAFDCSVCAAGSTEPMVSGVLTVYLSDSFEALGDELAGKAPQDD